MPKVKQPLIWFGGKGVFTDTLIPLIPDHKSYVEPFCGGAALFFAKKPSKLEVINDIDSDLINFYRAMQNTRERIILQARWQKTYYMRELYNEFLHTWREQEDRLERVYRWYFIARNSFSGRFGAGYMHALTERSPAKVWKNIVDQLDKVEDRLRDAQIENKDWREILDAYDHKDAFFYIDPPYVQSTRRSGGYSFEMTDEDHEELIEILQKLDGKAMLSGYSNPIYDKLKWDRRDIKVVAPSAGKTRNSGLQGKGMGKKKQSRIESIWTNYDTGTQMTLFNP